VIRRAGEDSDDDDTADTSDSNADAEPDEVTAENRLDA
jgi:hypothetical protein